MEHIKLTHTMWVGQTSNRDLTLERQTISNCSIDNTGFLSSPSLPLKAWRTPESHGSLVHTRMKVREAGTDVRGGGRCRGINVVETFTNKKEGRQAGKKQLLSLRPLAYGLSIAVWYFCSPHREVFPHSVNLSRTPPT